MAITLIHDCDIERRDDPTALNGDFRDTYIEGIAPDITHDGTQIVAGVVVPGGKGSEYERRALLLFDLNAFIPASATIVTALWHFYVVSTDSTSVQSFRIVRIRRHDWKEDEATWNSYKTGSAWGTAGASNTTTDRDTAISITLGPLITTGWFAKNALALVSDAWANRSGICTFILERNDGAMTTQGEAYIHAKNRRPYDVSQPHHLRITYTLDGRTFQAMVR